MGKFCPQWDFGGYQCNVLHQVALHGSNPVMLEFLGTTLTECHVDRWADWNCSSHNTILCLPTDSLSYCVLYMMNWTCRDRDSW